MGWRGLPQFGLSHGHVPSGGVRVLSMVTDHTLRRNALSGVRLSELQCAYDGSTCCQIFPYRKRNEWLISVR